MNYLPGVWRKSRKWWSCVNVLNRYSVGTTIRYTVVQIGWINNSYVQILYRPLNQNSHEWREARGLRDDYTAEMQQLMDEYGINSEAAIVSGEEEGIR